MIEDYKSYLLATKHIKEKYIPYYVKWISWCYNFLNKEIEKKLTIDKKQEFLKYLVKKYEDWQVTTNQALVDPAENLRLQIQSVMTTSGLILY